MREVDHFCSARELQMNLRHPQSARENTRRTIIFGRRNRRSRYRRKADRRPLRRQTSSQSRRWPGPAAEYPAARHREDGCRETNRGHRGTIAKVDLGPGEEHPPTNGAGAGKTVPGSGRTGSDRGVAAR